MFGSRITVGAALRGSLATALVLLVPRLARACTVCDSELGQQVRAGIFGENFWSTLLAVAAPFPVLLGAIAAVQFGLFRPRKIDR